MSGELKTVGFKQGDEVHKGQVLFTIDPQPYEAAVAQAEAKLAQDIAMSTQAQSQARRYANLAKDGVVSAEQNEQMQAASGADQSLVKADQSALDSAKLNLSYCTIVAPIDGRTGGLLVQAGNLVQPNTTILVTINQIAPIYTSFSVPEQFLGQLKTLNAQHALTVTAQAQGDPHPENGTLSFINNAIDATTGTIQLMATFPNKDEGLWPGEYVNVVIAMSVLKNATVVPSAAVLTGQDMFYVYVVTKEGTVQSQKVTTATTVNGKTVLTKGITPGETVVTDGQLSLSPGAKVLVRQAGPPTAVSPQPGEDRLASAK